MNGVLELREGGSLGASKDDTDEDKKEIATEDEKDKEKRDHGASNGRQCGLLKAATLPDLGDLLHNACLTPDLRGSIVVEH